VQNAQAQPHPLSVTLEIAYTIQMETTMPFLSVAYSFWGMERFSRTALIRTNLTFAIHHAANKSATEPNGSEPQRINKHSDSTSNSKGTVLQTQMEKVISVLTGTNEEEIGTQGRGLAGTT
jgi:hypothetical protein